MSYKSVLCGLPCMLKKIEKNSRKPQGQIKNKNKNFAGSNKKFENYGPYFTGSLIRRPLLIAKTKQFANKGRRSKGQKGTVSSVTFKHAKVKVLLCVCVLFDPFAFR